MIDQSHAEPESMRFATISWERRNELGIFQALFQTSIEICLRPTETFRALPKNESVWGALLFSVIMALIAKAIAIPLFVFQDFSFPSLIMFTGIAFWFATIPVIQVMYLVLLTTLSRLLSSLTFGRIVPFRDLFRIQAYVFGIFSIPANMLLVLAYSFQDSISPSPHMLLFALFYSLLSTSAHDGVLNEKRFGTFMGQFFLGIVTASFFALWTWESTGPGINAVGFFCVDLALPHLILGIG